VGSEAPRDHQTQSPTLSPLLLSLPRAGREGDVPILGGGGATEPTTKVPSVLLLQQMQTNDSCYNRVIMYVRGREREGVGGMFVLCI